MTQVLTLAMDKSNTSNATSTSRSVSGSTCVSSSPTSSKEDAPQSLEMLPYKPAQPHFGLGTPNLKHKEQREEILQIQMSHLVEMNDLKCLLACREMTHKHNLESLRHDHESTLDRVQREAQSSMSTTLGYVQRLHDQKVEALHDEHETKIRAIKQEHTAGIFRSRLSTLAAMSTFVDDREADQLALKRGLENREREHSVELSLHQQENESLRIALEDLGREHGTELSIRQQEKHSMKTGLEEL